MRLKTHVIISITMAGILWLILRSTVVSLAVLLSGIFIDLDHLIEYFYHEKKFSIKRFFYIFYGNEYRLKKVFLLFHSYELLLIISACALFSSNKALFFGLFIGLGHHMLIDVLTNEIKPWKYFLLYRMFNKFDASKFFSCS